MKPMDRRWSVTWLPQTMPVLSSALVSACLLRVLRYSRRLSTRSIGALRVPLLPSIGGPKTVPMLLRYGCRTTRPSANRKPALAVGPPPATMTPPPTEPSKQPTSAQTPSSNTLKFSKKQLALAFVIAGISDAIGAFITPLPAIGWVADLATALLLFMVLGRQWLLLPGLALEAIPGLGVLPFWLLVVGAIAVLGTPRPRFERH